MKRSAVRYGYLLLVVMFTGFLISGCGGGDSATGPGDDTSPAIALSFPAPDAPAVPIGVSLTSAFNEEMDIATINETTFTLYEGAVQIDGVVTYDNQIAIFNPVIDLKPNTEYTATITTGVTDLVGNPLASERVWKFTTDDGLVDASNPAVILTDPANSEGDVAPNISVTATFSEVMNSATLNDSTFTLYNTSSLAVPGTVSYVGQVATFSPDSTLVAGNYTAAISSAVEDMAGNFLVDNLNLVNDYVWTFTTGATNDITAPTVTFTSPDHLDIDVALSKNVSATFSESMNSATLNDMTFLLYNGASLDIPGTVSFFGQTATFNPDNDLDPGTEYTATITTAATDLAGIPLIADEEWTFTTIDALAQGQGPQPVDLGSAEQFAVISKSGISTTGTTFITGNIGVSPIDQTAFTGFGQILDGSGTFATSTLVSGELYASDYAVPTPAKMVTAINDLHTAYVDAASRTLPAATELYAGSLGGHTLAPGLYKWSTGVLVASGTTVTLSGGANDVWIMQIAGDLTVASNAIIALDGGAQAKNVFWQVGGGTGVTLEPYSQFNGIVLAAKGIVSKDGASVVGRLMAETNITLISNAITQP